MSYFESWEFKKLRRDSIETFGIKAQYDSLIEEMAELIVAISHKQKGRHGAELNVENELADVFITLNIVAGFFNSEDLQNQIHKKVGKLRTKIELGDISGNYL